MTDEETFAAFHRLRRHNSTRAERQAAWAATEVINERRRREAICRHPIAPQYRWFNFNDTTLADWTYPHLRTLELDEVEAMFPGAHVHFDWQCSDIEQARFVYDQWPDCLKVSTPRGSHGHNLTWMPEMKLWRRYSRAVKSKPHQAPREF